MSIGLRVCEEIPSRRIACGTRPSAALLVGQIVQSRHQARRDLVAALGKELGVLRRAHGLTQQEVASAVGTAKSNISRLESGRYGGLTVERFVAVLDAFEALGQRARPKPVAAGHRRAPPAKQRAGFER